jgi:signal transduction histidine kinase
MVQRGLRTMARQSLHLNHLVEELLDISRIQAGRFEIVRKDGVDLAQLVRTAAARFERELAIARCELVLDAPRPVVGRWDAARLDQVITNLLSNAFKFGPGRPIEVSVSNAPEVARLIVADHGIGIAREAHARIFDRFERGVSAEHYGGLGLGLYIVKQILEAHGGSIALASEIGAGARFTVTLPRD